MPSCQTLFKPYRERLTNTMDINLLSTPRCSNSKRTYFIGQVITKPRRNSILPPREVAAANKE